MSETSATATEIWKPIPDFPGYSVSNLGRVASFLSRRGRAASEPWKIADEPQRILQGHNGNYRRVLLRRDGKNYCRKVSNLVAEAFLGPCPSDLEVCHNDGDPHNDCVQNLRYDTHAANMRDAADQGRMRKVGSSLGSLSNAEAKQLRILRAKGFPIVQLCRLFRISRGMVSQVCSGRTYKEIGGPRTKRTILSREQAIEIRALYDQGLFLSEIARKYNVTEGAISRIIANHRHHDPGYRRKYRKPPLQEPTICISSRLTAKAIEFWHEMAERDRLRLWSELDLIIRNEYERRATSPTPEEIGILRDRLQRLIDERRGATVTEDPIQYETAGEQ